MKKNKKNKTIILIIFSILSIILFSSIAYSAFSSTMNITGTAHARVEADVRITDFRLASTNNATSSYEEFGKNHINSNINLSSSSSITYYLEITNYGSTDIGIYNITGLPTGLNYSFKDYNLKEKICNDEGKCNNFIAKTYELTITTNNTFNGDINLNFEFRVCHDIKYKYLNGNYPNYIIDGDSIQIDLSQDSPTNIYINSEINVNYSYQNKILSLNNITNSLEVEGVVPGTTFNYDYTGAIQEFVAPYNGIYKLEVWGAQGGTGYVETLSNPGGYGGYSTGKIKLNKGTKIYIAVGGQGAGVPATGTDRYNVIETLGGFNGGGTSYRQGEASGGGATSIQMSLINDGQLENYENNKNEIVIVAGGGGGGITYSSTNNKDFSGVGGHGGGYIGGAGTPNSSEIYGYGTGGTQAEGGVVVNYKMDTYYDSSTNGSFGKGATVNFEYSVQGDEKTLHGSGGGGGYYGGGALEHGTPGGGSGYIANYRLSNKHMSCYNCETTESTEIKTISTTNQSEIPISEYAKSGNGYSKITLLEEVFQYEIKYENLSGSYPTTVPLNGSLNVNFGENSPSELEVYIYGEKTTNYTYVENTLTLNNINGDVEIRAKSFDFEYTGNYQSYTIPKTGTYEVELWGAGSGNASSPGAYTSGTISLQNNDKLYIYVGGAPITTNGGYNGGGIGQYSISRAGGGATDLRLVNGEWNNFDSLKSRIMVAAGGGGSSHGGEGGAGGALAGQDGIPSPDTVAFTGPITIGLGGTQTSGGEPGYFSWIGTGPTSGGFGYGGKGNSEYGGAGGAGYYGGGGSGVTSGSRGGGAGGSSFISGYNGCDAIAEESTVDNIIHTGQSIHYSGYQFTNSQMIDGRSVMPTKNGVSTMIGNYGHGYAKITLIYTN